MKRIYLLGLEDTKYVTAKVLQALREVGDSQNVGFLVPAGTAKQLTQRVRTFISRRRKQMRWSGEPIDWFMLYTEVIPWTENGIRGQMILWSKKKTKINVVAETVEDMLKRNPIHGIVR